MPDPLKQQIAEIISSQQTLAAKVELISDMIHEYANVFCDHHETIRPVPWVKDMEKQIDEHYDYERGWKDAIHFSVGMIEESNKYHKNVSAALIKTVQEMPC
jgi:hypothetical protein